MRELYAIKPIELEIPVNVYLNGNEVVQAIASGYEDLGLKVKITELDFGTWMTKQIKAHDLAQMAFQTYAWPTLDADGLLSLTAPGNVYEVSRQTILDALMFPRDRAVSGNTWTTTNVSAFDKAVGIKNSNN